MDLSILLLTTRQQQCVLFYPQPAALHLSFRHNSFRLFRLCAKSAQNDLNSLRLLLLFSDDRLHSGDISSNRLQQMNLTELTCRTPHAIVEPIFAQIPQLRLKLLHRFVLNSFAFITSFSTHGQSMLLTSLYVSQKVSNGNLACEAESLTRELFINALNFKHNAVS